MHIMLNETDLSILDKSVVQIVGELNCHQNIDERLPNIRTYLRGVYTEEHKAYIINAIRNYRYLRSVKKSSVDLIINFIKNYT